ncbi:prealbumin-like fold domain-containing protein [Paenarthrobacter sp. NPDC089322]|uniref:MSCRAMM family protein n=1 Tax=Paenarthrobacter sp. NPDC089322 TaxID=3155065 RepID=UPI00342BCD2A
MKNKKLTSIGAAAACLALVLSATAAQANLPGSPFDAADGNLVLNDETQDWANAPISCVVPISGCGIDLDTGQNDNSFGQGTKEDTEVPSVVTGSIPNNKSDLLRFYAYLKTEANGDDYAYLAWERVQEPTGTTNMDFEFNKSTVKSANGITPVRTAGDVLIKYDLAQGGTNPVLGYHRWVTTGDKSQCDSANSVPCWGTVQDLTGDFEGSINSAQVVDPIAPNAPRNLSARTFGEAAINLTDAGIIPADSCETFSGAYLKSRSSDSFTAALKDFIAPVPLNFSKCGSIKIRKVTVGGDASFGYTTTGGLTPATFNLSNGGLRDFGSSVPAGTYSVTESTLPSGWTLTDLQCTSSGTGTSTSRSGATVNIVLGFQGSVDCTYTNTAKGTINVHKRDDGTGSGASLSGAVFTLFNNAAPLETRGAEDTTTGLTCTTDASGNCSFTDVLAGEYWVVETTTPPGYDTAADQRATVGAGGTVSLTFTDPRDFKIIVLVCKSADNSLYPSTVTVDGVDLTSLGTAPAGFTAAQLCGLGGAAYEDKKVGNHPANVAIPQ